MKVSVIVPAYNEETYIAECLENLVKQVEPADEIIVIDNNSTDKTASIARAYGVRVVKEKKQGMIFSRNKGFNSAKYEIIARTDADTRVPRNWIKRIKSNFRDKKTIAVSGPARFYEGLPDMVQVANWPSHILFFKLLKQTLKHNCLFGPNMAIRKTAWELVKDDVCLNDKDVHEDIDLSMHLSIYGKIKFDKKLVVNSSFRRFKKLTPYFEYPYRSIKTIRKHKKTIIEVHGRRLVSNVLRRSKTLIKHIQHIPQ